MGAPGLRRAKEKESALVRREQQPAVLLRMWPDLPMKLGGQHNVTLSSRVTKTVWYLFKIHHIDQWNKMESLEINPHE